MVVGAYFLFFLKNYIRSHRYLREIVLILIFHIFFWGFLYSKEPEAEIWIIFGTLGILLNLVTVPSIFLLEKGNSLYFGLIRKSGRINFFLSKFFLILLIDFFWILLFSVIYGLRFLDKDYFHLLIPRLTLMFLLMILSISILSLFFSHKPWFVWILMLLIVFGSIINKIALFPIHSIQEFYILFSFCLPPILEIIFSTVTLDFSFWRIIFLCNAFIQIAFYFILNIKFISQKDFL